MKGFITPFKELIGQTCVESFGDRLLFAISKKLLGDVIIGVGDQPGRTCYCRVPVTNGADTYPSWEYATVAPRGGGGLGRICLVSLFLDTPTSIYLKYVHTSLSLDVCLRSTSIMPERSVSIRNGHGRINVRA